MRVIAGSAGGIQLEVPKRGVRPTMDRVKAAIFSSLADRFSMHACSISSPEQVPLVSKRSAAARSVLFVDQDRQAIAAIEKNLTKTRLTGQARQREVFEFLGRAGDDTFDIIFADPPYEKTETGERFTEKLLTNERLRSLLAEDGIFILEKMPEETLTEAPGWDIIRRKTYGATEVLFLHPNRS